MNKVTEYALIIFLLSACNLTSKTAQSQASTAGDNVSLSVAPLALIGTNSPTISMSFQPLTTAGTTFGSVTNSNLFIKLTSVVPSGMQRKITVKLLSGSIPVGTQLTIQPTACTVSNSGGDLGVVSGSPLVINSIDQNLITSIGSCYTGSNSSDGYRMTFNWALISPATNYGQMVATTSNPVIVFTVTAPE